MNQVSDRLSAVDDLRKTQQISGLTDTLSTYYSYGTDNYLSYYILCGNVTSALSHPQDSGLYANIIGLLPTQCAVSSLVIHKPYSLIPGINWSGSATTPPNPRDPDHARAGIFVHHNCWKCGSGQKACAQGNPSRCEFPVARNH